ncbi:MAG: hypothetical protein FJZ47_01840 [Candidatus Tectomicrobia bacterium]|uniref:Uncharacterized protein n=1 Tax=Tectimicrobiota bacterium TaxID=2528274 RepID=A0A937VZ37_UNCTE|nr:hypothetical protein [Candidatus Tectomicrobia bacterium]
MSAYSCVIPISWFQRTHILLPAWRTAVQHPTGLMDFCTRCVPEALVSLQACPVSAFPVTFLDTIGWGHARKIMSTTQAVDALCHALRDPEPKALDLVGLLDQQRGALHRALEAVHDALAAIGGTIAADRLGQRPPLRWTFAADIGINTPPKGEQ